MCDTDTYSPSFCRLIIALDIPQLWAAEGLNQALNKVPPGRFPLLTGISFTFKATIHVFYAQETAVSYRLPSV